MDRICAGAAILKVTGFVTSTCSDEFNCSLIARGDCISLQTLRGWEAYLRLGDWMTESLSSTFLALHDVGHLLGQPALEIRPLTIEPIAG